MTSRSVTSRSAEEQNVNPDLSQGDRRVVTVFISRFRDGISRESLFCVLQKKKKKVSYITNTYVCGNVSVSKSVSEKVLEVIAEAEDIDASEIEEPLYEAVNPDGLDAIFKSKDSDATRNQGKVQFPYYGYKVTVTAQGNVKLQNPNRSN